MCCVLSANHNHNEMGLKNKGDTETTTLNPEFNPIIFNLVVYIEVHREHRHVTVNEQSVDFQDSLALLTTDPGSRATD